MDASEEKDDRRPKTKEDAEIALKLFCRKYELIKTYSFFNNPNLRISHKSKIEDGYINTTYEGPSSEQIDAVLLNFRFFLNRNEHTAVDYLKDCFDLIGIRDDIRKELDAVFKERQLWRKRHSNINGLPNSELFGILIYGDRVHANEEKRVLSYNELMKYDLIKSAELFFLSKIIYEYFIIIGKFYSLINRQNNP